MGPRYGLYILDEAPQSLIVVFLYRGDNVGLSPEKSGDPTSRGAYRDGVTGRTGALYQMSTQSNRVENFMGYDDKCTLTQASPSVTSATPSRKDRVRIGAGKYGTVYRESGGVVVKEVQARPTNKGMASPFREKIVAILQSLLVVNAVNPHFPLHYGFEATPPSESFSRTRLSYYLEEFEGSLDTMSCELLADKPARWMAALFQLLSASVTYSVVFGIVHNDLYPRNVLVKKTRATETTEYTLFGRAYRVEADFILAITDFGICTSPLLNCANETPQVCESMKGTDIPAGVPFGSVPPGKHILQYRTLPPFSRDVYMLLKWTVFPTKNFCRAPPPVVAWSRSALSNVDRNFDRFGDSAALSKLFAFVFSDKEMVRFDLSPFYRSNRGEEEAAAIDGQKASTSSGEGEERMVTRKGRPSRCRSGGGGLPVASAAAPFVLDGDTKGAMLLKASRLLNKLEY
jgi:hypothetical protein